MGILYTKTKVFHFKDKLDSLPRSTDKILPPIHIRIKPTNICCHNCKYCAYSRKNLKLFGKDEVKRVHIPRDKMIEILDDIIEMGVKAVTFSGGGEPFVYPYILDAVKKLSLTNIKFASLTNGSRLYGEAAKIFALYGTWIRISMDGWDDTSYSYYRDIPPGEFTKIMTNIENFKKFAGPCYLGVVLIVDEKNAPHVYEMLNRLKNAGVDSVKVSPCLVNDNAVDSNNYHKQIFHNVDEQVKRATEDLVDGSFEIFNAYNQLDEKFKKDYTWCPYLQVLPIIGADLNIYACPDKAYNLQNGSLGSIKNRRFRDFWFSNKDKFFLINPSKHCNNHCETNQKNKIIFEYLNADKNHLNFV